MDFSDLKILEVLLALLPGFLTSEVIGVLVVREERNPFERVVRALIFTFLSHVLWRLVASWFPATVAVQLLGLATCALLWGVSLTYVINSDRLHSVLRSLQLTRAASRPSEWYDAFYRRDWHVILHLKDKRRIFGWPLLWPQRGDTGHIFLTGAEWLDGTESLVDAPRVEILIPVGDIRFVEFVPPRIGAGALK